MQTQDPNQTKNMLLAVILSIGVMVAWQILYANPQLEQERERQRRLAEQQQSQTVGQQPGQTAPTAGAPTPGVTPGAGGVRAQLPARPTVLVDRKSSLSVDPRVAIETPAIQGSISLKGARIDDVVLKRYGVSPEEGSPRVVLFSPPTAPKPYFAQSYWVAPPGSNIPVPGPDTVWTASEGAKLTPASPLKLTWDNGAGLTFTRTVSVDDNYLFTIQDQVANAGSNPVTLFPYAQVFRYGIPTDLENFFIQHEGLIGVIGENGFTELDYSELLEEGSGKRVKGAVGGWLGITDKYWASAIIPPQSTPFEGNLYAPVKQAALGGQPTFQAEYITDGLTIPAGGNQSTTMHVFAGAKKVDVINAYESTLGIRQFELMVDWGWFY
ncbi:MAG: membrane protein insertase YidC, partial [Pseudomonadota bacterium]